MNTLAHLPKLAALSGWWLVATTAVATPPNDLFVNRTNLGSATSITVGGSTVAATLEKDENDLDSIGGASVWWKWTAPATGWVTVDTNGSGIDTVLAVLADGPTLDDTYTVGFNDESGAPDAPRGASRVVFRAVAGTEYHVAVHGFLGEQGSVQLNLRTGAEPPLRVTSLTLAPPSVNVTSAPGSVTVDVGLASDAPLAEGVVAVHKANFTGVTEVPFTAAQRVSGTATAGVYRVYMPVARYSTPGTWLLEIAASDTAGREAVFGRGVSAVFEYDHVLPDEAAGLFSVVNTGVVDDVAPQLVAFNRSPSAINVATNSAPLAFTFRVTDDLSGFGSGVLTLFTPSGEALAALPVTAAHRTAGTTLDGTFTVPFTLPAHMPTGQWFATLLLRDSTGNPTLIDGAVSGEDFPLGPESAEFAVTGAAHGYWAWIFPHLSSEADAQPTADLDGDGVSNLLEYAFGLSPSVSDAATASLTFDDESTGLSLSFVRRRASTASGVSCVAQFCGSLSGAGADSWQPSTTETVTPLGDRFERVQVTDSVPGPRRFGRVHVSLAP